MLAEINAGKGFHRSSNFYFLNVNRNHSMIV